MNEETDPDERTKAAFKHGLDALYAKLQLKIGDNFNRFCSHAKAACFAIPSEVIEYESRVEEIDALPSVSEEEEERVGRGVALAASANLSSEGVEDDE